MLFPEPDGHTIYYREEPASLFERMALLLQQCAALAVSAATNLNGTVEAPDESIAAGEIPSPSRTTYSCSWMMWLPIRPVVPPVYADNETSPKEAVLPSIQSSSSGAA